MEGLLLFRSDTTKAVYFWNGENVITVKEAKNRPLGKVMRGFPNEILKGAYLLSSDGFYVGESHYTILKMAYTNENTIF